ncbi:MAG: hypothetical protein K6F94_06655 [Bacteroidaceae bacterium]|nr:hypothetical protein [Bacteroidaceae bacterium]
MQQIFRKSILTTLVFLSAIGHVSAQEEEPESEGFQHFRIGGYGEMVASLKDYGLNRFNGSSLGNTKEHRATIAIPRFVLSGEYKFNRHWQLGAEIEFEAGGTGVAMELEKSENLVDRETEIEKGGEVALEQFHITYSLNRYFNVRAGHMVLPVGLTNAHHEPILFYGTVRPEGESTLIPSTWHETGLSIFGEFGRNRTRFSYQAFVTAGLNVMGFDRDKWAGGAHQALFEVDNLTCPAYTFRLDYKGVPGLRLGTSIYFCPNVGANTDGGTRSKNYAEYGSIPVTIVTADAQYLHRYFAIRANGLWGFLSKSDKVSFTNNRLTDPFSALTPVAHKVVSVGGEAGLNIRGFFGRKCPDIVPFVRYEYYNPQQEVVISTYNRDPADGRLKVGMWTAGLNYRPLPNLVIKADYTTRRINSGNCNRENEFAIGVAYAGWFLSK